MFWLFGYVRDKIGSSVCKLNIYEPVGTAKLFDWNKPDPVGDGDGVTRYRKVAYRYFSESEKFLKFRGGMLEIHPENEIYRDGKVHYYGVNAKTGSPVGFKDTADVVYKPEMLLEQFDVSDIKAGRSILSGLGGDWLKYVIGAAIGGFGVYTVLSVMGYVTIGAPK